MLVKAITMSDVPAEATIHVGTSVNFTAVLKNLTNETIHNVTIFQTYASNTETNTSKLISTPLGIFNGPKNYTSDVLFELKDTLSGNTLEFNYLNVTYNNFTLNLPELAAGKSIGIGYTVNFTKIKSQNFPACTVTYYDHWDDKYTVVGTSLSTFSVIEPKTNEIAPYFPDVKVNSSTDYSTILYALGSVVIIAILSRGVYFKNPFNL